MTRKQKLRASAAAAGSPLAQAVGAGKKTAKAKKTSRGK
jgi:hypothetical protein